MAAQRSPSAVEQAEQRQRENAAIAYGLKNQDRNFSTFD